MNRFYVAYCVVKVRLVVQHEEVQDLESPGLEPIAVAPERSVVQHGTLRPEVGVDGGDVILLGSVHLEEMSDLLQAEGMNPMSHSAVERREVHAGSPHTRARSDGNIITFNIFLFMENLERVIKPTRSHSFYYSLPRKSQLKM